MIIEIIWILFRLLKIIIFSNLENSNKEGKIFFHHFCFYETILLNMEVKYNDFNNTYEVRKKKNSNDFIFKKIKLKKVIDRIRNGNNFK